MNLTATDPGIGTVPAAPAVSPVSPATGSRAPDALLKGMAVPGAVQSEGFRSSAVEDAAAKLEEIARSIGRQLQFRVDQDSGRVVVSVRDTSTGELIRQIPSETALRIAEDLGAHSVGGSSLIVEGLA
ncbi:MAG: flagellar protein FlaG [Steroidobacteraceae bacterium]|nr:flagellar protein FlaG [Nevskiaceae bacterium]MCP5339075.1 flagellar protein FlaG [Nevskiaceae bacterium]MCP5359984.1 flagellar protein FlaG [Nevskiaceae bacterium]